ncbi:MAG: PAS domain S-box-containing protein [Natronomonas sp.]|jgi:PAS domain S-box-containing protein
MTDRAEFRTLLDTVPGGVFTLDTEERMHEVNAGWGEVVGVDPADLEGRPFSDLVENGTVPEPVVEEYRAVVSEVRSDSADREHRWLTVEVTPQDDRGPRVCEMHIMPLPHSGTFSGCAVAVRDVTDREQHREELERLREQTEFALAATDALIWTVDPETGRPLSCTGDAEAVFGVTVEAVETASDLFERVVHPEDRSAVERAWAELLEGESNDVTVQFRTGFTEDVETRWVETGAHRHGDGEGGWVVGMTTDITAQKRREQRLRRQNERLDEFAGVVSHDLRNPLNIARMRTELVAEDCDSEHIETVKDAHERMETLINEILTLAREGQGTADTGVVDLGKLARQAWYTVQTHSATLVTPGAATIQADPTRLQELLENLVTNAVEHGGHDVTVRVGVLADGSGFYVEDDGMGLSGAAHGQVFEPGYTTAEDGTGLGLAIVRDVADAHGWTVRAVSGTDGGARFEVTGVSFE